LPRAGAAAAAATRHHIDARSTRQQPTRPAAVVQCWWLVQLARTHARVSPQPHNAAAATSRLVCVCVCVPRFHLIRSSLSSSQPVIYAAVAAASTTRVISLTTAFQSFNLSTETASRPTCRLSFRLSSPGFSFKRKTPTVSQFIK